MQTAKEVNPGLISLPVIFQRTFGKKYGYNLKTRKKDPFYFLTVTFYFTSLFGIFTFIVRCEECLHFGLFFV